MTDLDEKICASCGRRITPRKRWRSNFEEIRYCSKRCRSRGVQPVDLSLEDAIMSLLEQRSSSATICPSEAARQLGVDDWRSLMEPARNAARRLVANGAIEILQRGHVVDPSDFKGPIRLRRKQARS